MVIGDKIILGGMVGLDSLAQYAVAALIASTTLFLVNNFATAWGGYLSKEIAHLETSHLIDIYYKNKVKLFIVIPLGISVYLIQFLIYKFFYEQSYPGLENIIFVLTFGYCCLGVSKYFVGYLSCMGKNYLVFYISIVSCLTMIITSTLILKGTLVEMAIAVSFSFFLQIIIFNFITNKVLTPNANG